MRRRVPAAVVILAHRLDLLPIQSHQAVQQRGLAHARRAKQRHRPPAAEVRCQRVKPVAVQGTDGVDRHAFQVAAELLDNRGDILTKIALGQHHDGEAAGEGGRGEEALDPAEIQVEVEEVTRKRTSRLAARIAAVAGAAGLYANSLLTRGRTASITAGPASADSHSATQSPTARKSARPTARWQSRPLTRATPSPDGPW
ncbi:MAG: hypothetical protein U0797_13020 [Gemmataceae bacterium]